MAQPKSLYHKKIIEFENRLKKTKSQLLTSSMLRLTIFLLIVFAVYLLWGSVQWIFLSIIIGLIPFFFLVSRHANLQHEQDKLKTLIAINTTEIEALKGQYSHLPSGKEFKDSSHAFSQDIDLFGKNSFYQYLNRTALKEGKQRLASILSENSTQNILAKQEAITDLEKKVDFRQEFSALAQLTNKEDENESSLPLQQQVNILKEHDFFSPKFTKPFALIFSIISTGLIIAFLTDIIAFMPVLLWLFLGLGITGFYLKRVNLLSDKVSKMQKIFSQYHKLLKLLEETTFSSKLLKQQKNYISKEKSKASKIIHDFSKAIDALDQRNNLLFGFLGNGFLLWDLQQSSKLEKWIKAYGDQIGNWFTVIEEIDAYNSLGNFAFNHPNYTYPKLTNNTTVINCKDAVHPLIPEDEAITNDYTIGKEEFLIITGANMAGKSTFLRTVSLQIVMSNIGLPIRASACEYTPIKLITSMRTVDSLAKEASYFYAELSRLKYIIDRLKEENYFIVLDEILKGTNSTDKAIGSRKFLEKLVASHSTGIIATHDLSLCKVAENLEKVKNYYFDAQIIDDELYFDYKFKEGICQNMNASFLLKKMEIIDR